MSRRVWSGHPPGGFAFRAVLQDRLLEQSRLVVPRAPATIDEELDPVAPGVGCSAAQCAEKSRIEVRYPRDLVGEDRRAVGDGTVSLAKRSMVLTAKSTVIGTRDADGRSARRG